MTFPKYAEYKHSGVEWLGEVPEHWTIIPLKWLVDNQRPIMYGIVLPGPDVGDGVPILKGGNVKPHRMRLDEMSRTTREIELPYARARLRTGDLVYAIRGTIGDCEIVPTELDGSNITQDVARVAPREEVDAVWLRFALLSAPVREELASSSLGATIRGVNIFDLRRAKIPTPAVSERRAIADFLNRETSKIDSLVAEQTRLIALLEEKRQAFISQSVTKGLNPKVKMKHSGIEWIGEVPAHWRISPIRSVARLESGHTPSRQRPEWWVDCTVPWFSLADIWQIREAGADVIYETAEKVSELGLANSSARLLPAGTVMLSRTASVGFSAIMGIPMATTQDFANWVCGPDLLPEYLLQFFRAMIPEFERMKMGSTHNTIYMPDLQAFRCALPPIDEQRAIVAEVRRTLEQLDNLANEARRASDLLRERREALIAAAVTGQIDVRGLSTEAAA